MAVMCREHDGESLYCRCPCVCYLDVFEMAQETLKSSLLVKRSAQCSYTQGNAEITDKVGGNYDL